MAYDTVSMSEMFPTCHKILRAKLVPIHYAELTKMALDYLGVDQSTINWQRQIEDVREKLPINQKYDVFYTGSPSFLMGLRWWFVSEQLRLLRPTSGIFIPGNTLSGVSGAFESIMRFPRMKAKTTASETIRAMACAKGLIIESHVSNWFKSNWPDFHLPPDNYRKWKKACNHDFKLRVDGKTFRIDVSGQHKDGTFTATKKNKTDFHLICKVQGTGVLWLDSIKGKDYNGVLFPESGVWPERIVTWLNCKKSGIDYEKILETI